MPAAVRHDFAALEQKWQARWSELDLHRADDHDGRPWFCMALAPSPSGELHMGHIVNYSIIDAIARYRRMRGYNVLSGMAWDSFGLPPENHAIRTGIPPQVSVERSIATIRRQMERLGFAFDWSREFTFSEPDYYRWTQWFFSRLREAGLAYRKEAAVNWCPSCQTVLANEQAFEGACERCGTSVERRYLKQWFYRITSYAAALLDELDDLEGKWPRHVIEMQRRWIGRNRGTRLRFPVVAPGSSLDGKPLEVFTTRADQVYGTTFLGLAPEHPFVEELVRGTAEAESVLAACKLFREANWVGGKNDPAQVDGVFTGRYGTNPFGGARVPIWVCNYVAGHVGTGAVMGGPAHDVKDFQLARRHGLPLRLAVQPPGDPLDPDSMDAPYDGQDGHLVDSGPFTGLPWGDETVERIRAHAQRLGVGEVMVTYQLEDWLISRQRYWGTPIPVVYCDDCGEVGVPDEDLPVLLPQISEYLPQGRPPLATSEKFVHTRCPRCRGPARRECDTMDTFVDTIWYPLRFPSPRLTDAPFEPRSLAYWMPVQECIGGIEHANRHFLYSRFMTRFLHERGLIPNREPYERLFCQGMVLSPAHHCPEHGWLSADQTEAGETATCRRCGCAVDVAMLKMSKSKNNGISPDELAKEYGADVVRTAILFMGAIDRDIGFHTQNVRGIARFFSRLHRLVRELAPELRAAVKEGAGAGDGADGDVHASWRELDSKSARALAELTEIFESRDYRFNRSLMRSMDLFKDLRSIVPPCTPPEQRLCHAILGRSIHMLAPFAPHLSEELWERLGNPGPSIFLSKWPSAAEAEVDTLAEVVVQLDGRFLATMKLPPQSDAEAAFEHARALEPVQAGLGRREVARKIWVPGQLLNLVTRGRAD